MISEDDRIHSDQLSEAGRWVSKEEAAVALGKTTRTIEAWIKAESIRSRIADGRREVFLRASKRPFEVSEMPPDDPKPEPKPFGSRSEVNSNGFGGISEEFGNRLMALSEKVLDLASENKQLAHELAQKSSEVVILNREMEARNTAITRYRDQEEENRRLREAQGEAEKKAALLAQELEALKTQIAQHKAPGWMFWKK